MAQVSAWLPNATFSYSDWYQCPIQGLKSLWNLVMELLIQDIYTLG